MGDNYGKTKKAKTTPAHRSRMDAYESCLGKRTLPLRNRQGFTRKIKKLGIQHRKNNNGQDGRQGFVKDQENSQPPAIQLCYHRKTGQKGRTQQYAQACLRRCPDSNDAISRRKRKSLKNRTRRSPQTVGQKTKQKAINIREAENVIF